MGFGNMFQSYDKYGNPLVLPWEDQSSDAVAYSLIVKNRKARDMSEARKWQAYARDLEASLKKAREERNAFFIQREAWIETMRAMDSQGVIALDKERVNALFRQKKVEVTQKFDEGAYYKK